MKRVVFLIYLLVLIFYSPLPSFAFWMWTPETNKWENPKYSVKDTPAGQLEYAKQFYTDKDYDKAINEFNKLINHYPKARQAPEAQYYIGASLEEQGKLYEAFKAYQMAIDKYPFSDRAPEIIKKEYAIGNKLVEGKGASNVLIGTLVGNNYDVIDIYKTVIKNAPYGELAASAQYKIGFYLQEKQLYQEARDEFEKVVNDYPESEWAKAAQYQIAFSDAKRSVDAQYDQKTTQAAVEEFKQFVQENPDAELSDKAKGHIQQLRDKDAENNYLVGMYYEKQKNYKPAKIYYQSVVNDFKDTSWAGKALERLRVLGFKE